MDEALVPMKSCCDCKNRRFSPKWMVKITENPIKMDDLGVPLFLETPIYKSELCIAMVLNS